MQDQTLDLLREAHDYARRYVSRVGERPVFPEEEALAALERFDGPLPEGTTAATDVLRELDELGAPATVAQTGGRYFGFVNGGALPVGLAARWMADAWDQNTAHWVMSPVAAKLEEVCERWLVELLCLPEGTAAGFETGTTLANFSALAAARDELLRCQGWDVGQDGLHGAPPLRIVVGADAHAAVYKSLALLGLGRRHVETVAVDDQGRMRLDAFPALDEPGARS